MSKKYLDAELYDLTLRMDRLSTSLAEKDHLGLFVSNCQARNKQTLQAARSAAVFFIFTAAFARHKKTRIIQAVADIGVDDLFEFSGNTAY
jgi:hypothetical protein